MGDDDLHVLLFKKEIIFIFSLLDLMTITSHDTYVKLIVSSLDYSRDGLGRVILSKGLTATSEVRKVNKSFYYIDSYQCKLTTVKSLLQAAPLLEAAPQL